MRSLPFHQKSDTFQDKVIILINTSTMTKIRKLKCGNTIFGHGIPVLLVIWLFPFIANAQAGRIEGRIVDSKTKEPLIGATVVLPDKKTGTTSDINGNFILNAPALPITLTINYIGYKPYELKVFDYTEPVIIALNEDRNLLNDVVVIGYGTQNRREFTGSIAVVKGDAIKDTPVQSFEQALQGKSAGVSISLPTGVLNAPPVVRIRGVNSISLSSYPLVVVDGVPVTTGNISSTRAANNPLSDINPADIESVDILKDAASTAIYGSRASAGVILITTKRGKQGHPVTTYDGWIGITRAVRIPRVLNATQYTDIKNEAIANRNQITGRNDPFAFALSYNPDGSVVDTNWRDYIYRTALSHNQTVSISGGSEKTSYYLSINYSDQEGFFTGNDFERKSIRFKLDNKITDWLRISGGAAYNVNSNKSFDSGSLPGESMTTTGLTRLALVLPPNVPAYNPDGSFNINPASNGTLGKGNNTANIPLFNPVSIFALTDNNSENSHFNGNISFSLNPLKQIELVTLYAVDRLDHEDYIYGSPNLGSNAFTTKGSVTNISNLRQHESWTNTLQLEDRFNEKHHISVLLGNDLQRNLRSSWGVTATQASDDFFKFYQGGWGNISATGNSLGERIFVSYFSRLSYGYNNRYFITGNLRRDGNSALATGKKYGNFGGVSAGWLLSDEPFFKASALTDNFSNVKLTASWGRVGNGTLANDYSSFDLYAASLYGSAATWSITQQGNPDLTWETSDQTNVGLSFGVWQNRLNAEITWFNNDVNGLILNTPQSPSKGIPNNIILANVGSLYNRGLEWSLGGQVIEASNFSWDVSFNYTAIQNKVTALAGGNEDIIGATGSGNTNITRVGESIGSLYGLRTLYVNPANGQQVFLNRAGEEVQFNGAGTWTYLDGRAATALTGADYYLLGNALPKWYGGLNSNMNYKRFELLLNFTYAGGNYVMNRTRSTLTDQIFFNSSTEILKRWTTPGQETSIPRLVNGDRISFGGGVPISEHVEKGDFLRLQNVTLAYKIPPSVLSAIKVSSVRVYGQINNALLLTRYTGVDPEVSANGNANTTPGVEYNTAGLGRTFTLGVNVKF
jgi:TonB-dependent starch-binding outer membrane protein SusC